MRATTVSFLLFGFVLPAALAQLTIGFYNRTCPNAESIVKKAVDDWFNRDNTTAAALLRMQFHDCFVMGCDASILIDPKPGKPSEKNSSADATVRGYDIIDDIKNRLEAECRNNVSCADIIVLATRDAVVRAGGPSYRVPTGRRDGLVSDPSKVNLPGPRISVSDAITAFGNKGFTADEFVVLLGAHTVGFTHCSSFRERIGDPSMDKNLSSSLSQTCSSPNDPVVALDQGTPLSVDNMFYLQIRKNRGILKIDQSIASDTATSGFVAIYESNKDLFRQRFAAAMEKLGRVEVLTGTQGEIRKNCREFNKPNNGKANGLIPPI